MKTRIENYTFSASAKTITFSDYTTISLDAVLIIVNVTDGIIIYNFADPAKGGSVLTNVLTLEYDTATMSDTDDLLIYYDDVDYAAFANLLDTLGDPLDVTLSGETGLKVMVYGLPDVYVRGNVAEGAAVSDPVYIGGRDASGNLYGIRTGQQLAANSLPIVLTAAQISTLTPPTPQTDALTDTELRDTPVPVSGTVTAKPNGLKFLEYEEIAVSNSSVLLVDSDQNANAVAVSVCNSGVDTIYLMIGASATVNIYIKSLEAGETWEFPLNYETSTTNDINAIRASAQSGASDNVEVVYWGEH